MDDPDRFVREAISKCKICGEPCDGRGGGTAEMYAPGAEVHEIEMGLASGLVHAECGLARGWEIS